MSSNLSIRVLANEKSKHKWEAVRGEEAWEDPVASGVDARTRAGVVSLQSHNQSRSG